MCRFIATVINLQMDSEAFPKMSSPRERETAKYLEKHKIIELMDNLTSMLFYYRPDHPKQFLIDQLENLKVSKDRTGNTQCLLNESNLEALFGILDPSNQGYITYGQYKEALKTLGIKNFCEYPNEASDDRISQETFIREATEGILRSATTFKLLEDST